MNKKISMLVVFLVNLMIISSSQAMVIEKIVAQVNGEAITSSQVNDELNVLRYNLAQQEKSPEEIEAQLPLQRGMIIDRLIEDKVILAAARTRKYDIPEERIALEVNKQMEMTKSRFPSEEDFYNELKKQGKTPGELKKDYHQEIFDELLRQEIVRREVSSLIDTTDDNVKEYYRQKFFQVKARHILVKSQEEAKKIYYQLKEGADFAALAQKYSLDPTASKGGDLGVLSRGTMIPSFEEAAFALKEGEFSEPVETPFGFHLIKVEKIEVPPDIKPLSAEELNALRKEYYDKELRYRYDKWIKGLKEKAVIEILDESYKK